MVLYVFVVAYVGGAGRAAAALGRRRRCASSRCCSRGALFVELSIAVLGTGAVGARQRGRGVRAPASARRREIGELFLTKFLLAFEVASLLLLVAAVGAVILARRRAGLDDPREISVADVHAAAGRRARRRRAGVDARGRRAAEATAMSIEWYLVVSALVFCIGAGGVLVRRNPLVILLCLELMLNAANLALVAFARMHGNRDGQIFALIVMVVAACEVAVGLGLIVAMYRRRLPIDVDELRELQG